MRKSPHIASGGWRKILPLHLAITILDPPVDESEERAQTLNSSSTPGNLSLFRSVVERVHGDPEKLDRAFKKALVRLPSQEPPPENIAVSPQFSKVLRSANDLSIAQKDSFIAIDHLIQALSQDLSIQRCMTDANIPDTKLLDSAILLFRGTRKVDSKTEDSEQDYETLRRFTIDMTSMARKGKIDHPFGREGEIRQILQILLRRTKKVPLLVGEPGVGKTTIVGGIANQIANLDIPAFFSNCKLLSLGVNSLITGNKYRGGIEERITDVLKEIENSKDFIVLFIDDIHLLMGPNAERQGVVNIATLLKPILANGQVSCVGATTPAEYKKNIEQDPFIARGFQQVLVKEPTVQETISILRGLKEKYEIHHGTNILDSAVVEAATLAAQHLKARSLPDSAIDLIDEAAAAVRLAPEIQPLALETVKRKLWELQTEIQALKREEDDAARVRLAQAQQEASAMEEDQKILCEKHENKKQRFSDIQDCKTRIRQFKVMLEEAERKGDIQLASDIKFFALPDTMARMQQLEADSARIDAEPCATRGSSGAPEVIYSDAVGPDQINEIVARWTGIPITQLGTSEEDRVL